MTKRHYYTCPIKALYMQREFGVKFINQSQIIEGVENIWKFGKKETSSNYDVAKESEHILKPKEGDLVTDGDLFGKVCSKSPYEDVLAFSIDDEGATRVVRGSEAKIIMRDNKQFFMIEVEND